MKKNQKAKSPENRVRNRNKKKARRARESREMSLIARQMKFISRDAAMTEEIGQNMVGNHPLILRNRLVRVPVYSFIKEK